MGTVVAAATAAVKVVMLMVDMAMWVAAGVVEPHRWCHAAAPDGSSASVDAAVAAASTTSDMIY